MHSDPSQRDDEEDVEEESVSESEPSGECEDDRCRGPTPPVWHCVDCDSSYCRYISFQNYVLDHLRLTTPL
jgi:hypothetical protein